MLCVKAVGRSAPCALRAPEWGLPLHAPGRAHHHLSHARIGKSQQNGRLQIVQVLSLKGRAHRAVVPLDMAADQEVIELHALRQVALQAIRSLGFSQSDSATMLEVSNTEHLNYRDGAAAACVLR